MQGFKDMMFLYFITSSQTQKLMYVQDSTMTQAVLPEFRGNSAPNVEENIKLWVNV